MHIKELIKNRQIRTLLKIGLGVFLILYLLSQLEMPQLVDTLKEANLNYFLLSTLVFLITIKIQALRLYVLLKDYNIPIVRIIKILYISILFNNFLPGSSGGDAYKIAYLYRGHKKKDLGKAFTLIMVERIVGLLVIIIAAFLYTLFIGDKILELFQVKSIDYGSLSTLAILFVAFFCIALLVLSRMKTLKNKIRVFISQCKDTLVSFSKNLIINVVIVSILAQISRMLGFWLLLCAVNICDFHFLDLILVIAIVSIASLIPISIGGLGIREGVMAATLIALGVPNYAAITSSILGRLTIWLQALIGGVVFLMKKEDENESLKTTP